MSNGYVTHSTIMTEREKNIVEKLHNLRDRICSYENLMAAYREAARNKRYRNEVIEFTLKLGENITQIRKELLECSYKVGPYREFYVRYPKPRLVMALGFRDRIVQWAIYRQINPYLDKRYIQHSYGCRKNKGTLAAAVCLHNWQQLISRKPDSNDWYIIKGDVSKYFYLVDHKEVLRTYSSVSDDPWFAWLIGTIINNPDVPFGLPLGTKPDDCPRDKRLYDVGMPIGNLTSQETANLFLDRLDQFCKHTLHLHYYVRYMDDFCIFVKGKENAQRIYAVISEFLKVELHLDISPKSTIQKATAPVEFVGYLITPYGIRIRKKTTRHIKRSLLFLKSQYEAGLISYVDLMVAKECYIGMCKHISGRNLVRWINDNISIQKEEKDMKQNEPPPNGRQFYAIFENENGTVDVYLRPEYPEGEQILVMKGVENSEDLEEKIRAHYEDWCASADVIPI